jgi:colanic acid biosynthesis glycosyl transferase WcaI
VGTASRLDMPKIVFVNRYYYPDQSATSQLLAGLATELAARGHPVVVITSRQRYQDNRAMLPRRGEHNGVLIHRVRTTNFGRFRLRGRIIDYLSFYLGAALRLRRYVERGDVAVIMTDPPLMSIAARLALSFKGAHQVNWIQDLFPEVAQTAGIPLMGSLPVRWLRRLRDWSLKGRTVNIAIGEHMARRISGAGASSVTVIHNWAVNNTIRPIPPQQNTKRTDLGLDDAFVVGYSGNLGRVHSFSAMLQAACHFQTEESSSAGLQPDVSSRRVKFVVIGGGYLISSMREAVDRMNLTNVQFVPYQPKSELAQTLCVPDVHWISLLPQFEGLIVPSKFYGVIAAGRPIIHVGAICGEIASLVSDAQCGYSIAEGDGKTFINIVNGLRSNPDRCRRLGDNARLLYEARFSQRRVWRQWTEVMQPYLQSNESVREVSDDESSVEVEGHRH